jgi:hypothetical protein
MDWHTIQLALIDGGDRSYSAEQAIAAFAQVSVAFRLDGACVPADQSRIKRLPDPQKLGVDVAYSQNWKTVVPSGAAAAGIHEAQAVIDDAVFGRDTVDFCVVLYPCQTAVEPMPALVGQ